MSIVKTIKAIPFQNEKVKVEMLREIARGRPKTVEEWAEAACELGRLIDRSCEAYAQGLSSDIAIWFTSDMQAVLRVLAGQEPSPS